MHALCADDNEGNSTNLFWLETISSFQATDSHLFVACPADSTCIGTHLTQTYHRPYGSTQTCLDFCYKPSTELLPRGRLWWSTTVGQDSQKWWNGPCCIWMSPPLTSTRYTHTLLHLVCATPCCGNPVFQYICQELKG